MVRHRNPFTYGELVRDEAFTDRRDELAQLTRDLANGQNVVLVAPRRLGKSSLVQTALRTAVARGTLVVEVDLMTTPTKERFAAKLAKSIHDDVASRVDRAKDVLGAFRSLRVSPVVTLGDDGSFRFSFTASRGAADIDDTIERLLELPAEIAAERGRPLVVFFDEFQEVTDLDPHLPALMRSIFQRQGDVAHVYAGSKRDMMHRLFNDENEPFFRSAKTMELGAIDPTLFRPFLAAQFERTDRGVTDDALTRLLEITGGHPYATQELASALWDEVPAGFTAGSDDLEDALAAVLRAENARFTLVWEGATSPQKVVLQALAKEPGRPFSEPYRIRHELPSASHVQRALRTLIRKELVAKGADGVHDLAEPFFREWLLAYAT
ncbi:MAG TPA: ATP-binding protein [Gaiellaceae bacterium]|nr:ATP-binding protein [Gaiellaceae bacterium]